MVDTAGSPTSASRLVLIDARRKESLTQVDAFKKLTRRLKARFYVDRLGYQSRTRAAIHDVMPVTGTVPRKRKGIPYTHIPLRPIALRVPAAFGMRSHTIDCVMRWPSCCPRRCHRCQRMR